MNHKLEYILAIAEEKSMTKAAKRLYITQPALTIYLNKLEDKLEAKLFDRTISPIEITPAGKYFIEESLRIEKLENKMYHKVKMIHNQKKLIVGMARNRANKWLPIILPEFKKLYHHDVDIEVLELGDTPVYQALSQGKIELGILSNSINLEGFEYELLQKEKVLFSVSRNDPLLEKYHMTQKQIEENSPDHPWKITAEDLDQVTLICPPQGYGLYQNTMDLIRRHHLTHSNLLHVEAETAYKLSAAGVGVAVTLSIFNEVTLNKNVEKPIFCTIDIPVATRDSVVAWQKDTILSEPAKQFIELLHQMMPFE